MAIWTSPEAHAPPRCYFSAAVWGHQLVIETDLAPDRVPWVFRGHTMSERHSRFPAGVAVPDPGANYCGDCGRLFVAQGRHEAFARHLAATEALPGAGSPAPAAPAAEVFGPARGGLAAVLEPRPAKSAAATPMEQGLEDQGPTRDLLKLLDEFSRR